MSAILRVFVSFSDDVRAERDLVYSVAEAINRNLAFVDIHKQLVVHDYKTAVPPDIHDGGAQGQIDEKLPPHSYDFFVGLYWWRFGKRSENGKAPKEHEIDRAIAAKKNTEKPNILVYFCEEYREGGTEQDHEQLL